MTFKRDDDVLITLAAREPPGGWLQDKLQLCVTHFDILCDDVRVVADGLHKEDL